jgi:HTTM domain/Vitamin K-dependent gamma-carboxylase, lumenal domain
LFAPVDGASIVFFRVFFGLLMVWDLLPYSLGSRLENLYLTPIFAFKYLGFAWVEEASAPVLKGLFWVLTVLAACIAVGLWYRIVTVLFFLGITYVFLLDAATYNNHDYLICLISLLLVFLPAHRGASVDAYLKPGLRSPAVPAWALWLLRFQIGVPYFFGGLAKINYDWVVRAQPMKIWLRAGGTEDVLPRWFTESTSAAYFFSWGGLVLDLLVVPLLLYRRTRLAAYLVAATFHLTNSQIFTIGVFPWFMIVASTIYFDPGWPRRFGLMKPLARGSDPKPPPVSPGRRRLVAAGLGLWVAVQVLMPLRHFLYPGNVDWTDQAHRFSWRMKLRDKYGEVRFVLVDRASRKATVYQDLDAALTKRQQDMMMHDPDMIRQFAHFLADLQRAQGRRDFEVRVLTRISFNDRPPRPLIDPNVDLAAQPSSLAPASWILPLGD